MTGNETLKELFDNHTTDELLQMYKEWHLRKEIGTTRSPEDIVKGLECCRTAGGCKECPYSGNESLWGCEEDTLLKDAIAFIKYSQKKVEEKHD